MKVIPESVHGCRLPDAMRELLEQGRWPALIRLGTHAFEARPNLAFMSDIDLTLTEFSRIVSENELADMPCDEVLLTHTYSQSVDGKKRGLPWLDVESALSIGGGADWGDDTSLVLDYRESAFQPRVVVSEWIHDDDLPSLLWHEISPSFEAFLENVRTPEGDWVSGRSAGRYAAYYDNLDEAERAAVKAEMDGC